MVLGAAVKTFIVWEVCIMFRRHTGAVQRAAKPQSHVLTLDGNTMVKLRTNIVYTRYWPD